MSSTDSDCSLCSEDSQSPVIDGMEYGSESSVNDGEREKLEVQKPAGVNEGYGSETYGTTEENSYFKPVEVDKVHDSQLSVISKGADHFPEPEIDEKTCHFNAFKIDDGSEASTAVREGLDRQLWILALLFEDLDPLAKTNEGTYKMTSEQLWNEFSTVHDIREKYDLKDQGLFTDIGEVANRFGYESPSKVDRYISERFKPFHQRFELETDDEVHRQIATELGQDQDLWLSAMKRTVPTDDLRKTAESFLPLLSDIGLMDTVIGKVVTSMSGTRMGKYCDRKAIRQDQRDADHHLGHQERMKSIRKWSKSIGEGFGEVPGSLEDVWDVDENKPWPAEYVAGP